MNRCNRHLQLACSARSSAGLFGLQLADATFRADASDLGPDETSSHVRGVLVGCASEERLYMKGGGSGRHFGSCRRRSFFSTWSRCKGRPIASERRFCLCRAWPVSVAGVGRRDRSCQPSDGDTQGANQRPRAEPPWARSVSAPLDKVSPSFRCRPWARVAPEGDAFRKQVARSFPRTGVRPVDRPNPVLSNRSAVFLPALAVRDCQGRGRPGQGVLGWLAVARLLEDQ